MKHATMKTLYTLILILLAVTAYGQSNLPTCKGSDTTKWNNCFGSWAGTDGQKYVGDWKGGSFHAKGTLKFSNGEKYIGWFSNDKYNGQGSFTFVDGSKYVGEWKEGKKNGQGIYTHPGGDKYVGEYKDNIQHGQGTYIFASGDKYVGEYKDGNKHGQGTYAFANGTNYVGEYKDGKYNGRGTMTLADGDKYVGEYKDNKMNGQGTYYYLANNPFKGDKYVGEWKDDKANGQGTYTKANGDNYVGEFMDGKRNGLGIIYSANGIIQESGNYKDDKFVTSKYIDPIGFTRIARNNAVPVVNAPQQRETEQKNAQLEQEHIRLNEKRSALERASPELEIKTSHILLNSFEEAKNILYQIKKYPESQKKELFNQYAKNYSLDPGTRKNGGELGWSKKGVFVKEYEDVAWLLNIGEISLPTKSAFGWHLIFLENRNFVNKNLIREHATQSSRISITASASQPDLNGVVTINILTNTDTSSLKINGEELGGNTDGSYVVKRIARVGQETKFTIAGIDINGNTDTKIITVSRMVVESKVTYPELNPERIKRQPERDAVAVIIGISNYKSLPKADYAKDAAQVFFDYAIRALGVRPGNIKLLMDEQADAEEIYTAFKTWLPARVKSTTDVYVFYSGHGLPTQDGSGLYWLPQRANRDLISKTGMAYCCQKLTATYKPLSPSL